MLRAVLFCLSLATLSISSARAAGSLDIKVQRTHAETGAFFDIRASGFARAPLEHVWQVLTDYQRQAEYVPNLTGARIISRSGSEVLLDQNGNGGFFFFKRAVHLQVRVVETPKSIIEVGLVSGDMKRYSARWQLTPTELNGESGTRIDYAGSLEPDFFVPPLIGNAIVQNDIRKMLAAVIDELEK